MMSRSTSRVQRSPKISSDRLTGHPDRMSLCTTHLRTSCIPQAVCPTLETSCTTRSVFGGVMSLDALHSGAATDIRRGVVEVNGAPMRVAEAGDGPLVLLLHGFP